jgi:hypothetical protein
VTLLGAIIANDYYHDVFATAQRFVPPAEQTSVAHSGTAPHLVGIGQGFGEPLAMLRQ